MLSSFRVQNFKCFEDLRLEGLGRINLIAGANNVGKTALLEALYLDDTHDFVRSVLEVLAQRKQSPNPTAQNNIAEWFTNEDLPILFNCHAPATFAFPGPHIVRSTAQKVYSVPHYFVEPESRMLPLSAQFKNSVAIWQGGLDPAFRDRYWDHLQIAGEQERIFDFLRIIEPSIERVGLLNDGAAIRQPYYWSKGQSFRLSRLGAGMDRLLGIAFGLGCAQGHRLLIDEFETGLHYSILERVWLQVFETASLLDVQVFATTHSLDCLRAFAQAAAKHTAEGKYFRLDRNLGSLRAVALNEEELSFATEAGMEVR